MSPKPAFLQRVQYFFDNFMSRGTVALIGGLALFIAVTCPFLLFLPFNL